jgi:hypothetical protein
VVVAFFRQETPVSDINQSVYRIGRSAAMVCLGMLLFSSPVETFCPRGMRKQSSGHRNPASKALRLAVPAQQSPPFVPRGRIGRMAKESGHPKPIGRENLEFDDARATSPANATVAEFARNRQTPAKVPIVSLLTQSPRQEEPKKFARNLF